MSIIMISPEKFWGSFDAIVSSVWVTVDAYTWLMLILTVMVNVVESSPGVSGKDGFTHCVG